MDLDDIASQRELLAQHRRTLAIYLRQRDNFGADYAPPYIHNGIAEARAEIQRIKAGLSTQGATVDDAPGDELTPEEAAQAAHPSREVRLRALLHDHSGFINDRLASFVGREAEIVEIRQRIDNLILTGGYITITGQAGQGKSSIIAKLVSEYGSNNVAYHFIPFNPGPDHQVSLLRNLMACLILKHHLSEIYVASENQSTLQAYFGKVIGEISEQSGQAIIFIDGLDQIEAKDTTGLRDLSFLPSNVPTGIVFVLGTRPNDTLRSLEPLKPLVEYKLPDVSRQDFDRILTHRSATLTSSQADRFYNTMQGNALYLDLLAVQLKQALDTDADTIIEQVNDNPNALFSFAIRQRLHIWEPWERVGRPILRFLLVAAQPLSAVALHHLIHAPFDLVQEGLLKLGGLLTRDTSDCVTLFHIKFREYLRRDVFSASELIDAQAAIATWCLPEPEEAEVLWLDTDAREEQERRSYARHHTVTHLFHAKAWERMWKVLESGPFISLKLQHDPGAQSVVYDLDLVRRATVNAAGNAIELLPRLWRYSWLRCELSGRAEDFPDELFEALARAGREQEAISMAEIINEPGRKALLLARIGVQSAKEHMDRLADQAITIGLAIENKSWRAEVLSQIALLLARVTSPQVVMRAQEAARHSATTITFEPLRAEILWRVALVGIEIGTMDVQLTDEVLETARAILEPVDRVIALGRATSILAGLNKERARVVYEEVLEVARSLDNPGARTLGLCSAAEALTTLDNDADTRPLLEEASSQCSLVSDPYVLEQVLQALVREMARTGDFENAESLVQEYAGGHSIQAQLLGGIAQAYMKMSQPNDAYRVCRKIEVMARNDPNARSRMISLSIVAKNLAEFNRPLAARKLCDEAIAASSESGDIRSRTWILSDVAMALSRGGRPNDAVRAFHQALALARRSSSAEDRTELLALLAQSQAHIGLLTNALEVCAEVLRDTTNHTDQVLLSIVIALTQAGAIDQGLDIARALHIPEARVEALAYVAAALQDKRHFKDSDAIRNEALDVLHELETRSDLSSYTRTLCRVLPLLASDLQGNSNATSLHVAVGLLLLRATTAVREMYDRAERADLLASLALAHFYTRHHAIALACGEEALEIADACDEIIRARLLVQIAHLLTLADEPDAARERVEQALPIARRSKEPYHHATIVGAAASVFARLGLADQAVQLSKEVMKVARSLGDSSPRSEILLEVAQVFRQMRSTPHLLRLVQQAWFQTSSREALCELFPLAVGIIEQVPQLGIELAGSI